MAPWNERQTGNIHVETLFATGYLKKYNLQLSARNGNV
jgi:hypothetical protein